MVQVFVMFINFKEENKLFKTRINELLVNEYKQCYWNNYEKYLDDVLSLISDKDKLKSEVERMINDYFKFKIDELNEDQKLAEANKLLKQLKKGFEIEIDVSK